MAQPAPPLRRPAVAAPRLAALLAAALAVAVPSALAQPAPVAVPVRVGEHAGFGRLVLDLPTPTAPGLEREAGRVTLRLPASQIPDIEAARRRLPPQFAALASAPGELTLEIAAEAQLRHFRLGNRLVIDALFD